MTNLERIQGILETQLKRIYDRSSDKDLTKDDAQVLYTLSQIIHLHNKFPTNPDEDLEEVSDIDPQELTNKLKKSK